MQHHAFTARLFCCIRANSIDYSISPQRLHRSLSLSLSQQRRSFSGLEGNGCTSLGKLKLGYKRFINSYTAFTLACPIHVLVTTSLRSDDVPQRRSTPFCLLYGCDNLASLKKGLSITDSDAGGQEIANN